MENWIKIQLLHFLQQLLLMEKKYEVAYYDLNVIISVGYRVNSKQATQFRIWATQTLKEYILLKGLS
jgi:hypothetical protein